jgi:sialate O-acetylesterase
MAAWADVKIAAVFTDHMVLQRDKPVPVWGTAEPAESVSVAFAGQTCETVADLEGRWRVELAPLRLNKTPSSLTVRGNNTITLNDVLVGDVWLCGGQSNMAWALGGTLDGRKIIQAAEHANLRLLQVPKKISSEPLDAFASTWVASSPQTAGGFSAVGFIFGQRIHTETDVPIGLIQCAVGSTSVECWVSNKTLEGALFAPAIIKWREVAANWSDPAVRDKHVHNKHINDDTIVPSDARTWPGGCYNGMLHPLFPFACKGVIWYQGEANRFRGVQYRDLFPAMVAEWRVGFKQDDLRFYIVQLPEIGKPKSTVGDSLLAELREAQTLAATQDPLMEMAVIIDSDQQGNLHPKNKHLPGARLAAVALARDYGRDVEYRGPVFQALEIRGDAARVSFFHAKGLMRAKRTAPASIEIEAVDEPLANFAIAGEDRVFHPAEAVLDGETIVVTSDAVKRPVAVRYAWSDSPFGCNLYNAAGFPAGPFRTDDWPGISEGNFEGRVLIIR